MMMVSFVSNRVKQSLHSLRLNTVFPSILRPCGFFLGVRESIVRTFPSHTGQRMFHLLEAVIQVPDLSV